MSNELVKIDPKEFGISDDAAKKVKAAFVPMLDKMEELEGEFNEIVSEAEKGKPPESLCQKAGELRKRFVKIRTGVDKIHKEQKSFYLQAGRFVDGWKNAHKMASGNKEGTLKEIEDYYANIEKARVNALSEELHKKVAQYLEEEYIPERMGDMDDGVFAAYLEGVKKKHDDRKAAEEAAEKARIEKEKAKAAEEERIRKENEELKKQQAELEKKAAAERKAAQIKADKEREERARAEREAERILQEERAEREKLEKAERERKAAEAQKAAEEKAEKERLAQAPDKDRLLAYWDEIDKAVIPEVDSEKAANIIERFIRTMQGFKEEIEAL